MHLTLRGGVVLTISEQQARLWCLIIGAVGAFIVGPWLFVLGETMIGATAIGTAVFLALLAWLYSRGWDMARFVAIAVIVATMASVSEAGTVLNGALVSGIFALLLGNPWSIVGASTLTAAGIILRSWLSRDLTQGGNSIDLLILVLLVGILAITRLVLNTERRKSQEFAAGAEAARRRSDEQSAELALQAAALTNQNEQQRRLLDLVATLETPAVNIAEGVVLAPLVGHFDSRRATELTSRLLVLVSEQRSRRIILDLAGVSVIDSLVARSLMSTVQALQLLGCEVGISGISASVAATMAQLKLDLGKVKTWRSPQEALEALMDAPAGLQARP